MIPKRMGGNRQGAQIRRFGFPYIMYNRVSESAIL